jgi:hypothetical protein
MWPEIIVATVIQGHCCNNPIQGHCCNNVMEDATDRHEGSIRCSSLTLKRIERLKSFQINLQFLMIFVVYAMCQFF